MLGIMCVHLSELIRLTRRVARYTQHLPIVCHGLPGAAKKTSPLDMQAETNRAQYVLNITITNCSRMRGGYPTGASWPVAGRLCRLRGEVE
jgi:hypothetical protein